ncbi:exodeoxyribonuclease VII large subunit [Tessaracoccus oleiagri]|uniref:Exodeoxyribonuclease 7 large subunit n=1 Tax=Tessaracoccus oleiagri TaxID=686624 RepID=A0A1G9JSL0_9ACTN|nr:exodeoxyribonuclease VII large subunit [Tessaracoccus oleiagri]SDL40529.1 Exodeoxyribonuclease VII large subunit [Tessaracoccus oleiagri]
MALPNSKESPQPLGRIVMGVKDWIGRLGEVWVDAQVVEIKRRNAPTQFLTLRDRMADISAQVTTTSLVLDSAGPVPEGSRVVARLKARVWERNTSLSFECLELHVAGEGRLLAQLEQLKRKLQAEGLFDPLRKKRLPMLPRVIGLVTGRDSDAERDVLTNIERRWPAAQVRVEHALVQGVNAAESVMTALAKLDGDPHVDVIIIARGGGSMEDLLPFSDEGLVRAVARATTPVVSAIGHEPDTPIVDFVADVRASTPTDAAKRVVPDVAQELGIVDDLRRRLRQAVVGRLDREQRQLDEVRSRPVLVDPTSAFDAHYERLGFLRHRLRTTIESRLRDDQADVARLLAGVRAMSPMRTLERGYAVLVADDHRTVSSVADAATGQRVHAHLSDGELTLDVADITERSRHG